MDFDDDVDEQPSGPRPELREVGVHVAVTVLLAVLTAFVGLASSGGLRDVLVLAAPGVVFVGALAAAWRTYSCYRADGRWQIWQGGMWFLMVITLAWFFGAVPAVVQG
ncbi:hypothetical protein [Gordonia sp. VNK21]|uniref:hypothetical protein n=1 Tax=Gordonia sp. VNK21 TaxID=3382483 RepID=UPI0038D36965